MPASTADNSAASDTTLEDAAVVEGAGTRVVPSTVTGIVAVTVDPPVPVTSSPP